MAIKIEFYTSIHPKPSAVPSARFAFDYTRFIVTLLKRPIYFARLMSHHYSSAMFQYAELHMGSFVEFVTWEYDRHSQLKGSDPLT